MTTQLGKPTAFPTWSAPEVHWDRLIGQLECIKVHGDDTQRWFVQEMAFLERVELRNDDPEACALYADKRFDVILNILKDRRITPFKPCQYLSKASIQRRD